MKSLLFWSGEATAGAQARAAAGARLVAWGDAAADALAAAGVPHVAARELLTPADLDEADEAAIAWTRRFGRRPLVDGKSFRDLFAWKGVSLWWFAELYLHHSTGSPRRVRLIEAFWRLLEREAPDEVEARGLPEEEALLLARCCQARAILFHDPPDPPLARARRRAFWIRLESRWNEAKTLLTAAKAALAGAAALPEPDGARRRVLFLSHAAFWRERPAEGGGTVELEHYFGRLIPETSASPDLEATVLAVGPRTAFRRRGRRHALREWLSLRGREPYLHVNRFVDGALCRVVRSATRELRRAHAQLRDSPALQEAFSHRGVRFADLAEPDLAGTLLLQLPWAVRCFEEMSAALRALRPAAACLYAESSGWGRAALAACRGQAVPSLGVQHGILYPSYYSYRHEPDEADCPRPDRTAVFGEAARRFLAEAGRYDETSLVVTGSPRFDELLEASRSWDRDALRAGFGVGPGEALLLVASRFRGIRETHQSIGSAFPALVRAAAELPRARLLVKPHPAEGAADYERVLREQGAPRAAVLPPQADLLRALFACDVLVTVESLSAVEALVLDRPVVVLNMPTNLREMVDAGVALGVARGAPVLPALRAALEDEASRAALARARRSYLADVASGVDGRATERLLALIRETAGGLS